MLYEASRRVREAWQRVERLEDMIAELKQRPSIVSDKAVQARHLTRCIDTIQQVVALHELNADKATLRRSKDFRDAARACQDTLAYLRSDD